MKNDLEILKKNYFSESFDQSLLSKFCRKYNVSKVIVLRGLINNK